MSPDAHLFSDNDECSQNPFNLSSPFEPKLDILFLLDDVSNRRRCGIGQGSWFGKNADSICLTKTQRRSHRSGRSADPQGGFLGPYHNPYFQTERRLARIDSYGSLSSGGEIDISAILYDDLL